MGWGGEGVHCRGKLWGGEGVHCRGKLWGGEGVHCRGKLWGGEGRVFTVGEAMGWGGCSL